MGVCVDGCVLRREQMEQSEQPDGEQLTDRKGKRGPQPLSAKKLHTPNLPE